MKLLTPVFCLLLSVSAQAREKIEGILAIVNTEVVTETDLKSFQRKVDSGSIIDDLLLLGASPDSLKGNRKAQINYLVTEKLLESEIKRLNLSVTIERVEQELKEIAKKNGISRPELNNAIRGQGMVFSDYQDFIKGRIERQSLIEQEISSKIRVSDEEVSAEFARLHPEANQGTSEYTVAHILFNPKKGGAAAASERGKAVLKKLASGGTFEAVAEQNSEDSHFVAGGILGTFKGGEFSQDLEKVVSKLSPGEVSTELTSSKMGLHILKLVSKKMVPDPRFEKEKEKIRSALSEKAFGKQLKNWIEVKKEEAFIRMNES